MSLTDFLDAKSRGAPRDDDPFCSKIAACVQKFKIDKAMLPPQTAANRGNGHGSIPNNRGHRHRQVDRQVDRHAAAPHGRWQSRVANAPRTRRSISGNISAACKLCVDMLNKCTSKNADAMATTVGCTLAASGTSDQDVQDIARIVVSKTEAHPQYASTYVKAAKALAAKVNGLGDNLVLRLDHRSKDAIEVFLSQKRCLVTEVKKLIEFSNRVSAYIAYEHAGLLKDCETNIANTAMRVLAAGEDYEVAFKVLKMTLVDCPKCLKHQFFQMLTSERQRGLTPKCRFLVQDIEAMCCN